MQDYVFFFFSLFITFEFTSSRVYSFSTGAGAFKVSLYKKKNSSSSALFTESALLWVGLWTYFIHTGYFTHFGVVEKSRLSIVEIFSNDYVQGTVVTAGEFSFLIVGPFSLSCLLSVVCAIAQNPLSSELETFGWRIYC